MNNIPVQAFNDCGGGMTSLRRVDKYNFSITSIVNNCKQPVVVSPYGKDEEVEIGQVLLHILSHSIP